MSASVAAGRLAAQRRHRLLRRRRRARRLRQPRRQPEGRATAAERDRARRRRPLDRGPTANYDGFDPVTFLRADTLDETENRIGAVRALGAAGEWGGWSARAEASLSRQRQPQPAGRRAAQQHLRRPADPRRARSRRGSAAISSSPPSSIRQEDFRARDTAFFGGTDQDRVAQPHRLRRRMAGRMERRRSSPTSPSATTASAPSPTRPPCAPRCWSGRRGGSTLHRRLWRRHRPADLLRPVTASSRAPSSAIRRCGPRQSRGWEAGIALAGRAASRFGVTGFSEPPRGRDRRRLRSRHLPLQHRQCRAARAAATASSSSAATAMPTGSNLDDQLHLARRATSSASPAPRWCARCSRPRHSANLVAQGECRPLQLGREPGLCRRAARHGFRPVSGADRDPRRLCCWPRSTSPSGSCRSSSSTRGSRTASTPTIRTWSATTRRDGRSMRAFASLLAD